MNRHFSGFNVPIWSELGAFLADVRDISAE